MRELLGIYGSKVDMNDDLFEHHDGVYGVYCIYPLGGHSHARK